MLLLSVRQRLDDNVFLNSGPFWGGIVVLLIIGIIHEACDTLPADKNAHVNVVSISLSAYPKASSVPCALKYREP